MDEQPLPDGILGPSDPAIREAAPSASLVTGRGRRGGAIGGGLLAGLGLSIAVALVMHVVQVASNNYYVNIDPYVDLVVFVAGPIFGLGVGLALMALIPPRGPDSRGRE
jgi:hypothetical protein